MSKVLDDEMVDRLFFSLIQLPTFTVMHYLQFPLQLITWKLNQKGWEESNPHAWLMLNNKLYHETYIKLRPPPTEQQWEATQ